MSTPRETTEPSDQVPELPGGPAIAGHYVNAILHNPHHHIDDGAVPPAPSSPHPPAGQSTVDSAPHPRPHTRRRSSSASSHVPIDFFDREGVKELKRSLTSQSNALAQAAERALSQANAQKGRHTPPAPSNSSQATAVSGSDAFDLEKHLRESVLKCVYFW